MMEYTFGIKKTRSSNGMWIAYVHHRNIWGVGKTKREALEKMMDKIETMESGSVKREAAIILDR